MIPPPMMMTSIASGERSSMNYYVSEAAITHLVALASR
jgi:hypothetical protein